MCYPNHKLCLPLVLSLLVMAIGQSAIGDDNTITPAYSGLSEDLSGGVRFAIDDHSIDDFWLTQTQPNTAQPNTTQPNTTQPNTTQLRATARSRPTRSRSQAVAARRRQSTYRLPSMFGDFYGGSSLQATLQLPTLRISQMFVDGVGGVDFFVTNLNGGNGADANPAVGIEVRENSRTGTIITMSTGPGVTVGQTINYPIQDPSIAGFFPPQTPGTGVVTYDGGTAFFTGASGGVDVGDGWGIQFSHLFAPDPIVVNIPSGGGAVRRVKIGENNSPMPHDRFIFNYNFFNDVIGGIGDVNRYTVGFEHTFFEGTSSIEVLFPMASTLDVDQIAGGMRSTDTEFGDLTLVFKHLLLEQEEFVVSAGFGLTIPTGDDARVFNTSGQQIIDIDHVSTHLLPYVAMLRTYDSGWYWQSFVQLDIDLNGNPISADMTGTNLQLVGVLQDQTLLFVDVGVGYWLHGPDQGLPAIAATAELHWASTLQNADVVGAAGLNITSASNRYDVVNLSLGTSILVNDSFTVRPAMVIPLASGDGEQFDYEAMVQMNFWR